MFTAILLHGDAPIFSLQTYLARIGNVRRNGEHALIRTLCAEEKTSPIYLQFAKPNNWHWCRARAIASKTTNTTSVALVIQALANA